jgi:hypothetical protein
MLVSHIQGMARRWGEISQEHEDKELSEGSRDRAARGDQWQGRM